jgi:hypothetical protein
VVPATNALPGEVIGPAMLGVGTASAARTDSATTTSSTRTTANLRIGELYARGRRGVKTCELGDSAASKPRREEPPAYGSRCASTTAGRVIDLSTSAAAKIGIGKQGMAPVKLEVVGEAPAKKAAK